MVSQYGFGAPKWVEPAVAYRSEQIPIHAVQSRIVRIRLVPGGQRAVMLNKIRLFHARALNMASVMLEFRS